MSQRFSFIPTVQLMDQRTQAYVDFICPSRLAETDIEFNSETIMAEQPDPNGPVILLLNDRRSMVGQSALNHHQKIYCLFRQQDAISYLKSLDFYAKLPSNCLQLTSQTQAQGEQGELLKNEPEILTSLGVDWGKPGELSCYLVSTERNRLVRERDDESNSNLSFSDPEIEDILVEELVVSFSADPPRVIYRTFSRISSPLSTELSKAAGSFEETQLWFARFWSKEEEIKSEEDCTSENSSPSLKNEVWKRLMSGESLESLVTEYPRLLFKYEKLREAVHHLKKFERVITPREKRDPTKIVVDDIGMNRIGDPVTIELDPTDHIVIAHNKCGQEMDISVEKQPPLSNGDVCSHILLRCGRCKTPFSKWRKHWNKTSMGQEVEESSEDEEGNYAVRVRKIVHKEEGQP